MEPTSQGELYAELVVHSSSYAIDSFRGREAVNQLFQFNLCFYSDKAIDEQLWLGQPAFLSIQYPQGQRRFKARVFRINQQPLFQSKRYLIRCELSPGLLLLSFDGQPRYHPESSLMALAGRLLEKKVQYEWLEPLRGRRRQQHWLQSENETDLQFFQRLLATDGVNYLCNCSNEQDAELFIFEENTSSPVFFNSPLYWRPETDGSLLQQDALFDLSVKDYLAEHQLIYRSPDPDGFKNYIEARAGQGERQSMLWGIHAESCAELQQKARHHVEALTLSQKQFQACTHQPLMAAGQCFEGRHFPRGISSSRFIILEVEHFFEQGRYKNRLRFVDEQQSIRPMPIHLSLGQQLKTACIYEDKLNPLLDENGGYAFQHQFYQYEKQQPLPRAGRLTPYLESSRNNSSSGLHFPLQSGTEVLSIALFAVPERVILLGSPANGCCPAALTAANPWSLLLKSAWGQYLQFSEKNEKTDICLANARARNALRFVDDDIELNADAGWIDAKSEGVFQLSANGKSCFETGKDLLFSAKKKADLIAKQLHFQGVNGEYEVNQDLKFSASSALEMSSGQLKFQCSQSLELIAEKQDFLAELKQGDLLFQVDELSLIANQQLCIEVNAAKIELNPDGIQMHADKIEFQTQSLQWQSGVNYVPSAAKALAALAAASLPALMPVKQYQHLQSQRLGEVEWGASFYHLNDTALIQFEIAGFDGTETVKLMFYSADISDVLHLHSKHPFIGEIPSAKRLDVREYSLSDKTIYLDNDSEAFTCGTGRIKIEYPLKLLKKNDRNNRVYFVRLQVADSIGQRFSNPMIMLAQADIELMADKKISCFTQQSLIEIKRCLPMSVRMLADSPDIITPYFYREVIHAKNLPVGQGNRLRLLQSGIYQELFIPKSRPPTYQLPFDVGAAEKNHCNIQRLMPSMRIDFNHAYLDDNEQIAFSRSTPESRDCLNSEEIEYINACQNHLTLFIHGYNVAYGRFGYHLDEEDGCLSVSSVEASIYRDKAYFSKFFEQEYQDGGLNGEGMHSWITHLEQNINQAAGMEEQDYSEFTRCLFIGWPGKPSNALAYNQSIQKAIDTAPVLGRFIENLHQQLQGVKLHVIAHSLGCGLLLQAMDWLGKKGITNRIEHVFLCQPAIPSGALKTYGINTPDSPAYQQLKASHPHYPWVCPFAYKVSRYIRIFYSKNDNILGPMPGRAAQPAAINRMELLKKKPFEETLAMLFAKFTGMESIYLAANRIGQPRYDLFHESTLHNLWLNLTARQACINIAGSRLQCRPGLLAQLTLLETSGMDIFFKEQRIKRRLRHLLKAVNVLHRKQILPAIKKPAESGLLSALWRQAESAPVSKEGLNRFYQSHRSLIVQLIAFIESIPLLDKALFQPAMGYVGAEWATDRRLVAMAESGHLKNVDTSEYILHHSHMQEINKNIQSALFCQNILEVDDMMFG